QWAGIGLYPEMNLDYGIDELAVHDPLTPAAYFESWPVPDAGQLAGGANLFGPAVNSVALARRYGARYVLVQTAGQIPVPSGMHRVATIEGPTKAKLTLASVPGSARFTFPAGRARVLSSSHPGDATYEVRVHVPRGAAQQLILHITATPGWHVAADGRALAVHVVDGTFLSVSVPAGTRTVVATYDPALLELGYALALAALAVLALLVVAESGPVSRRIRARMSRRAA
ncbi:MAG TPA: YfhO family protein, partial [Acidimicrobiales bacterium]|nr:YfhO family protein [Acidimicrobiales bacterium]